MMLSFILLLVVLLSAVVAYKKRFTSGTKIAGLYLVQIYYLFITPVAALLLFDIGSDIFSRPLSGNLPVPSNILFNAYNFSVMTGVVGMAIHSTSTSVFQSFKEKLGPEKEAFDTNELFHGPWSHNMVYAGSVSSLLILGLLEINHPYFGTVFEFNLLIFAGIIVGILGTITALRALPIKYDLLLILSLFGSVLLGYCIRTFGVNINYYPMTIVAISSLVSLWVLLLLSFIVFVISESLSHKVIKRTFPKGHPFHEGIDMKVLFKKIEHDFE